MDSKPPAAGRKKAKASSQTAALTSPAALPGMAISPSSSSSSTLGPAKKATTTDRRSRTGCVECRRIRRKCDETRPHCLACVSAGKQCSYNQPLRWGGRPFKKSAFGQQLGSGVGIIVQEGPSRNAAHSHRTDSNPAFVYGPVGAVPSTTAIIKRDPATRKSSTPPQVQFASDATPKSDSQSSDDVEEVVREVVGVSQPPPAINWLNWLSPQHRFLVHHFMTKFSKCFSLHPSMHQRFCSALVPFALDKTHGIHLLAAVLVASARHRKALGSPVDDARIDKLATISVGHLARQPIGRDPKINHVAAATALVLCMAEIQAGGEKPGTWKVHLNGAKAILSSSETMQNGQPDTSSTFRLLRRWCQSLDIMSMSASGASPPAGPSLSGPIPGHIDMFEGYSMSLLPIFKQMSDLVRTRAAIIQIESDSGPTDESRTMEEHMMERGRDIDSQIGLLSTQIRDVLDISRQPLPGPCTDYQNLNEAYHCAARLEIRHNTLKLPLDDPETVAIVKRGIAALQRMNLEGAAPSSKTLHVAFSLGSAACHPEDRSFILDWIDRLYREFGMLNTKHAREILLEHWHRLENGMPYIRPRQLALMKGWELIFY